MDTENGGEEIYENDLSKCYDGTSAEDEDMYQAINQGEQNPAYEELQFQK
jgi:hypothetical protein